MGIETTKNQHNADTNKCIGPMRIRHRLASLFYQIKQLEEQIVVLTDEQIVEKVVDNAAKSKIEYSPWKPLDSTGDLHKRADEWLSLPIQSRARVAP